MKGMLTKKLQNQKGFTLIELLAVIVILGIILAIAIPAVSSLIENSRIDAHISNAQQFESSAKLYFSENPNAPEVDLDTLVSDGLLEAMDDPHGDEYDGEASVVTVDKDTTPHIYETTLASGDEVYLTGEAAADYTRDHFRPNED